MKKYAVSSMRVDEMLFVEYSDGSIESFNLTDLGCDWFKMSNDGFYEKYGFNFNPHEYKGLYEVCSKIVFGR